MVSIVKNKIVKKFIKMKHYTLNIKFEKEGMMFILDFIQEK